MEKTELLEQLKEKQRDPDALIMLFLLQQEEKRNDEDWHEWSMKHIKKLIKDVAALEKEKKPNMW